MTQNEFAQRLAISAARSAGAALADPTSSCSLMGERTALYVTTVTNGLLQRGYFKDSEPDPAELPSPDPRLLSVLDALRNANDVATAQNAALREENAALRQQLDALRNENEALKGNLEASSEAQRYTERMLAIATYFLTVNRPATIALHIPREVALAAMSYIRVGGHASVAHSPDGIRIAFVTEPAVKGEAPR